MRASFAWYHTYSGDYAKYVTDDAADTYLQGDEVKWDDQLTQEQKIERIIFQKYCVGFFQGDWDPFLSICVQAILSLLIWQIIRFLIVGCIRKQRTSTILRM